MQLLNEEKLNIARCCKLIVDFILENPSYIELMLKEADIKNKSKIVELQMSKAKDNVVDAENDFLDELQKGMQ